ncbi:YggW family oxidoreductase [Candidatus Pantoea edessiphila]|uniref:Heme chaperone HemW n=1 Tax=Candidatus Pantoea edessiphila TaxID=2044610 RepID=A0A2P5SXS4_9GAMM|nr:radical SAM family heme chaperone HemW [Candidatus Pantoea edessiphila]MBK4775751.1 radical SAM family heme chaperone HemW [Pantoea sp. Edef]PPI87147.1 YggW family oxidoreductase [Candidatus Pantoea edessiphila]
MYLPPLSLYIHIPWCIKKCYYCDFNSHELKKNVLYLNYINHLLLDLNNDKYLINDRKICTIFIGGGTPSLIDIEAMKILINGIKESLNLSIDIEITIEINPGTVNVDLLSCYKNQEINRISVGAQSFSDKHLVRLGRIHSSTETHNVIHLIKDLGIHNINIDLMHGLPNQSIQEALNDLHQTILFDIPHISWYQLTIEPNTMFGSKNVILPNDNKLSRIFKEGHNLLIQSGYKQYEISNYAKSNYYCKHNLNYWYFGDYIGIGCGAHGKITLSDGKIIRTVKNRQPKEFMKGFYINKRYIVSDIDKPFEYFMNRFRLNKIVSRKEFEIFTGLKEDYIRYNMDKAITAGYVIETNKHWQISKKGRRFLNDLLELFLIEG